MYFVQEYLTDPVKYSFEGAMNFMGFNLNLIQHNLARAPKDANVVADISLLVQHAYSKGNMPESELKIIHDIIRASYAKVPPVDLRIVTHMPLEKNLERIRERGRPFEMNVPPEHLDKTGRLIDEAIDLFGREVPTLRLDASELNWAHIPADQEAVLNLARRRLGL
jgi:deoxyadenosine/deoxycytidine kinase